MKYIAASLTAPAGLAVILAFSGCASQQQIDQAAALNVQLTSAASDLTRAVVATGLLAPQDAAAAVLATAAVAAGAKIIQQDLTAPVPK